MKKIILFLVAAASVLTAHAQFPDWGPQSRIVTDSIQSRVLNATRQFNIFLPQSYEADKAKTYPVLYLLHGMMDTHQGWAMRGHVKDVMDQLTASGEACEMIIVTPNAAWQSGHGAKRLFQYAGLGLRGFFLSGVHALY